MFNGKVVVFEGPEDYHDRIEDPSLGIDEHTVLVIRNAGPVGYPGSAEVVNMQPPAALMKAGVDTLPTMGDGRQSGTSGSPSILNVSPEAAVGGGLALLKTGDPIRIDLNTRKVDVMIPEAELAARRAAWVKPKLSTRRPGRRSTAPWSASSVPAAAWSRRRCISTSWRRGARAGTTTDTDQSGTHQSGKWRASAFRIGVMPVGAPSSWQAGGRDAAPCTRLMFMSRILIAAGVAAALGFGPALAQPAPANSATARTLAQNQSAYVAPTYAPQAAQPQPAPAAQAGPRQAKAPPKMAASGVVVADRNGR